MSETTIHCPTGLRATWPDPLVDQWAAAYSDIFDADDCRLAKSRPRYHFFEWFAAIHLFHRDGTLSLLEKYGYGNHIHKQDRLESLLSEDDRRFIAKFRDRFGVQPPDLLVYRSGQQYCWFAEVKGPGDTVSAGQRASWAALEERFGSAVELINVVESTTT